MYADTFTIAFPVRPGGGEGDPENLAERYYGMYVKRDRIEDVVSGLEAVRAAIPDMRAS